MTRETKYLSPGQLQWLPLFGLLLYSQVQFQQTIQNRVTFSSNVSCAETIILFGWTWKNNINLARLQNTFLLFSFQLCVVPHREDLANAATLWLWKITTGRKKKQKS